MTQLSLNCLKEASDDLLKFCNPRFKTPRLKRKMCLCNTIRALLASLFLIKILFVNFQEKLKPLPLRLRPKPRPSRWPKRPMHGRSTKRPPS
jgi:hypothetical protein